MLKATNDKVAKSLINAIARLGYQLCLDQDHDRNVIISPVGIISMLAMVYAGAQGETRQQLASVLGDGGTEATLSNLAALIHELGERSQLTAAEVHAIRQWQTKQEELRAQGGTPQEAAWEVLQRMGSIGLNSQDVLGFKLVVANSLWLQADYSYQSAFLTQVRDMLKAQVNLVNFQERRDEACALMNVWVRGNTHGLITSIMTPAMLPTIVRAIPANAVYFKGLWQQEFSSPYPGSFHLFDGTTAQVQMMNQQEYRLYVENKDFRAVILPYKYRPVSMILVLPQLSGKRAFIELERKLAQKEYDYLVTGAKKQEVRLTMPEFEIDFQKDLRPILSELGLGSVFAKGDFSGISDEAGFGIDSMLHQARIHLDRYGTEAAATATSVIFGMSVPPKLVEFKLDRPFLFLILDEPTGIVLFAGRFVRPG